MTRRAALMLGGLALLGGCGRELQLNARETATPDVVMQGYQVTVYATSAGATSYAAYAIYSTNSGAADGTPLPDGDTVTLNGVAMPVIKDGHYGTSGTGNPGTFTFAWTDAGTAYTNTLTPSVVDPSAVPARVSKSGANTLAVAAPAGTDVAATVATVDSTTRAEGPSFALPVQVSGGGTAAAAQGNADLSGLPAGDGVVSLLESTKGTLTSPTAAGGYTLITVQLSYDVTIAE